MSSNTARLRAVHQGEYLRVQFEVEPTSRRQIQEVVHSEKYFNEAGIQSETEACAAHLPSGSRWKAMRLTEYPGADERKREPAWLIGVEDRLFAEAEAEVEGHGRSGSVADEDRDRGDSENAGTTSAVNFVRFE